MIPEHLQEKNALQIANQIRYSESGMDEYVMKLERFVIVAIKDALCAAESCHDMNNPEYVNYHMRGQYAEQRAIVFLNMVLPKE